MNSNASSSNATNANATSGGVKELTAAVHVRTFDTSGGKMQDVSAFADVFDRVNIMTYDINGAWNKTTGKNIFHLLAINKISIGFTASFLGPNAPFNFEPGYGDADSFVSGIEAWNKAGMPYEKICPGVAFYGRSASEFDLLRRHILALYSTYGHFFNSCNGGHDKDEPIPAADRWQGPSR